MKLPEEWITKLPPMPANSYGVDHIGKYVGMLSVSFVKSIIAGWSLVLRVLDVIQRSARNKIKEIYESKNSKV